MIRNVCRSLCKVSVILSSFKQKWDVLSHISTIPQYQIWWKVLSVFLEFFFLICVHMNIWITGWKEEAVLKGALHSHDIKTWFKKFPHSNPLALNKHCVKTTVNWNKNVAGKITNELVFYLTNCSCNTSVSLHVTCFISISHWTDIRSCIYVNANANVNVNVMSHIGKSATNTAQMHTWKLCFEDLRIHCIR